MAGVTGTPAAATAAGAENFVQTLGVNTHIDFQAYGYQNLRTVEAAINYLGLSNLRDSPENLADLGANGWWQQVANATGAKFDAFLGEGSYSQMTSDLGRAAQLAQQGILNFIEGGNEEDDPYPASLGNTMALTAQFQQTVYQTAHQYGLPAINMSFGAGWTSANNWHGDYDKVGNLAPYADYANAHTYPSGAPDQTIQMLNADAQIAAVGRPVITTEIGWDANTTDLTSAAKYTLDAALDGFKDGDAKTYFYALFDDGSGKFGLMNADGSAKPAGVALHNLTTLLADNPPASFSPGTLSYGLANTVAGDNSLLFAKSDGSFWLAIWNEQAATHAVTLSLGAAATSLQVFDPLTGTSAVQSVSNASQLQVTISDHPILVEIGGAGGDPSPTPKDLALSTPATETLSAGATLAIPGVAITDVWALTASGNMALNVYDSAGTISIAGHSYGPGGGKVAGGMITGTEAQLNAALASLAYTAGSSAGSDILTIDVLNQAGVEVTKTIAVTVQAKADPPGAVIALPGSPTVMSGATTTINGVSFTDPIGAGPGSLALNLRATNGVIAMTDAGGHAIAGSGTGAISVVGTMAQLNADLATLAFTGAAQGSARITVDIWDQYGIESVASLGIAVGSAPITIPASQATATITADNTTITTTGGNHMIFIAGTANTITATGGREQITALGGHNSITTGTGNDRIQIGGSGNVVDAGSGTNVISDSGSGNTFVLPTAGNGVDSIQSSLASTGDWLDLRRTLAATAWNGDRSSLSNYLRANVVSSTQTNLVVMPLGVAGSPAYRIAQFSEATNLQTVLAHSIV